MVTANIVNWQCNAIDDGWSVDEIDGATASIDPAGQLNVTCTGSPSSRGGPKRSSGITSLQYTLETRIRKDANFGAIGSDNFLQIRCSASSGGDQTLFICQIYAAELSVYDGSSFNEVGTNVVPNDTDWHIYRFEINGTTPASATCDVYIDGSQEGDDIDCSAVSVETSWQPYFQLRGYSAATQMHIDYIKIGSGLGEFGVLSGQPMYFSGGVALG